MIKINKFFRLNVIAVLLIGFLTVGVYGTDYKPVAEEMIGSSGISWAPKVSYSQLVVTIARPDGTTFRQAFDSGSSPYVGLSNIFGESYLDGSYTYELVVVPSEKRVRGSMEKRSAGSEWHDKGLTQSGGFFVQGGAIVSDAIYEPGSEEAAGPISGAQDGLSGAKDIQHLDDVIISFSLCVGNDCVNGESFGFDTIRLKENNLRIHFQDTSSSASFPTNDWRIVINDSSNGGASYFAVEDSNSGRQVFKVLAGAPANSLYVNASGNVGLGTSSPVVDAHIVSGNTPTLRLEQNGSSGFTPQTWDVAGNEANFFVRDATNGSTLPFKIKPGAPTGSIFVAADGDIGLGTESPNAPLHVKDSAGTASTVLELENDGPTRLRLTNSTADFWDINSSANGLRMNANGSSTVAFRLDTNGNVTLSGTLTTGSSTVYPDYVFESDYNLLTLEELSEYIEKEGHLPNIPKAEEAKKNGINVTELQMKLLEKVEELTLYTLSQEKTIKELKKEISQLKNNK